MEDFSKITISTKQLENGSYVIGSDAEAAFKKIISFINSVTETRNKYAEEYTRVNSSGYMEKSVFVPKSLLEAVTKRIDAYAGETSGKANGTPFAYKIDPSVKALETTLNLTGAKAQSEAVLAASRIGGSYNKDTGKLIFPKPEDIKSRLDELEYIKKQFAKPMQSSYGVEEARRQLLQQREDERVIKEQLKQEEKSQKLNRWWKAEGASAARKYDAEQEKKRQRQQEKEEEDRDENKRENFTSGFFKDPLVKILSLLGITVALIRRIIARLPSQAIQLAKDAAKEDAQTALALGLTKRQMRDFKVFETAHGLDAGTFAGAVSEVNKNFGRIDKLDNDSVQVKNIALLGQAAGNDKLVEDLVTMQLTQEQPDVLLAKILDAAMAAYAGSKDILTGERVGKEASMRSILSHLEEAGFEDVAVLFKQAVSDKEQGIYKDSFKNFTYEGWLGTTAKNITGLTDAYLDALKVMGQEFNAIAGKLKDITDSVLTRFAVSLVKIADWIDNQRIFLSPEENKALNRKNYNLQLEASSKYSKKMALTESSFRQRYKTVTGRDFTGDMNNITLADIEALGGDTQAMSYIADYGAYGKRLDEAKEQIANWKAGKNVSYNRAQGTTEFVRLDAEEDLYKFYEQMVNNLFTRGAKNKSLSDAERQIVRGTFSEIMDRGSLEAGSLKGLSVNNPYVSALLSLYKTARGTDLGAKKNLTEEQAAILAQFASGLNMSQMQDFVIDVGMGIGGTGLGEVGKNVRNEALVQARQMASSQADQALLWQHTNEWLLTGEANRKLASWKEKGYTPTGRTTLSTDPTSRKSVLTIELKNGRETKNFSTGYVIDQELSHPVTGQTLEMAAVANE